MTNHELDIQSVSKRFGNVVALDDVSLSIGPSEFVTLLGPSGCGKTTLLRIVAGFVHPDSGTVRLDGLDLTDLPPHRRNVHTVFQNYALFPHMTVQKNVSFGLEQTSKDRSEIARKVDEALEMVRLQDLGERYPSQLSGGQQQRVALARALVLEPMVLLLDEPLAALDRHLREAMQIELKSIQRSLGISFLFVTHDQDEALSMSDRIVVMNEGRIEQIGTPRDVYRTPRSRFTAGFVGISNLLSGRILDASDSSHHLETDLGTFRLGASDGTGTEATISLRPEDISVHAGEVPEGIPVVVEAVRYQGDTTHARVTLSNGETWMVALSNGHEMTVPEVGTTVYLSWRPEDAVLVR